MKQKQLGDMSNAEREGSQTEPHERPALACGGVVPIGEFLAAWTPIHYHPPYPPYVSVSREGPSGFACITVRGGTKPDGSVGDWVQIVCNEASLIQISAAISNAAKALAGRPLGTKPESGTNANAQTDK